MDSSMKREKYHVMIGPTRQLGARLDVSPDENEAGLAVVEHTLPPGGLAAPPHRHSREDEFSYVLEGELTVWEEGRVVAVPAGQWIVKPRNRLHTFWNAGPQPLRFIELIAPGEFAWFFPEADAILPNSGDVTEEHVRQFDELNARYGLEMDWDAVPGLVEQYGLKL